MPTATIDIHGCIQDCGDTSVPKDKMLSRVFFDISVGDRKHQGCHVEFSQPAGSDYSSAPIEFGLPHGYSGQSWNQDEFSAGVESYYRTVVCGPNTGGVRVGEGSFVRMRNHKVMSPHTFEFELSD